jgi:putative transposase
VISKKKTCRIMRRMGLAGLCPGPNLSKRNHKEAIRPYLLRGVKAAHPNHIWGIDITYIRMQGSFMYLVAIIDWYSRYLVSWELSQSLERSFVLRALNKAFATGRPKILNSDQGSHFTSSDYLFLLEKNQISISMDGKGRATDNAITERFFRNLKWEKLYYHSYSSPKEVYRDVRAYIDEYNRVRPHQSLHYAKPAEFYAHVVEQTG